MIVPTPPPSVVSAPSSFRLQPLRRRYLESQTLQPPLSPSFQTVGPSRTRRKDRVQVSCGLPNRIKLRSSSRRSNYENDWPKAATPFPHDPDTNYLEKSPDSRPLAVSDTPCYLDAVKAEFRDRPDVYNRFLDIMQDFRSGAIDTPGAKQRVSILFDKSPRLFKGFDNFLSEGHRIDTPSVTALHNSPSEVPLSRGAAHSPKEQKDTSGAEPITPTQSIQQYHWTPITFIRHHNVYDHSTRHNEIDLSVNKSVDFSTSTYRHLRVIF
ncbi:hypothetical protein BDN72DRAFT_765775 [Pluteus cervinus]|uniref:Uncharacterized protein n=1 Tax=Pluteus cervinus TaxID=181527 RepID=A0ACD3AZF8_9AGAR|nr:hypothetical protein BDN72DRAFT_765775 [Pluteus cervinus]